jgi:hypothetical protein
VTYNSQNDHFQHEQHRHSLRTILEARRKGRRPWLDDEQQSHSGRPVEHHPGVGPSVHRRGFRADSRRCYCHQVARTGCGRVWRLYHVRVASLLRHRRLPNAAHWKVAANHRPECLIITDFWTSGNRYPDTCIRSKLESAGPQLPVLRMV